jgi:hypothetical protein
MGFINSPGFERVYKKFSHAAAQRRDEKASPLRRRAAA